MGRDKTYSTISEQEARMTQIKFYNKLQKDLHKDIQKLITTGKYIKLDADEVLAVFGRVYSVYALECLREQGVIEFTQSKREVDK